MPVYEGSYKCKKCGAFPWRYKIEDNPNLITYTGKETLNASDPLYLDKSTIRINLRCPTCGCDYPIKVARK